MQCCLTYHKCIKCPMRNWPTLLFLLQSSVYLFYYSWSDYNLFSGQDTLFEILSHIFHRCLVKEKVCIFYSWCDYLGAINRYYFNISWWTKLTLPILKEISITALKEKGHYGLSPKINTAMAWWSFNKSITMTYS